LVLEKPPLSKPQTLADHLKRKRLKLGLSQKELGKLLGADRTTIRNWERWRTSPALNYIPKIIEFLGYLPPQLKAETLTEKIKLFRKLFGLSQKDLAKILRVDPSTIWRWEKGKGQPSQKLLNLIDNFSLNQLGKTSKPQGVRK
jgi:transcriptional regulator with XRE-family HTH domain